MIDYIWDPTGKSIDLWIVCTHQYMIYTDAYRYHMHIQQVCGAQTLRTAAQSHHGVSRSSSMPSFGKGSRVHHSCSPCVSQFFFDEAIYIYMYQLRFIKVLKLHDATDSSSFPRDKVNWVQEWVKTQRTVWMRCATTCCYNSGCLVC